MKLFDTHSHIHFADYPLDRDEVIARGQDADVHGFMAVGCTLADSELGIRFVQDKPEAWAAIGLHPHEAAEYVDDQAALDRFAALAAEPKVKAIGECGLDFYYENAPREAQETLLRFQLALAQAHNLPLIFHVRDAFAEFWPIFDEYPGLRGVIHSFTATEKELSEAVERGLYIGLNGIMTFTKRSAQLAAAKAVPLSNLVLETDAPFLTPVPYRGKVCELYHIRTIAEFLADLRGETLETLASATTKNARQLFNL